MAVSGTDDSGELAVEEPTLEEREPNEEELDNEAVSISILRAAFHFGVVKPSVELLLSLAFKLDALLFEESERSVSITDSMAFAFRTWITERKRKQWKRSYRSVLILHCRARAMKGVESESRGRVVGILQIFTSAAGIYGANERRPRVCLYYLLLLLQWGLVQ